MIQMIHRRIPVLINCVERIPSYLRGSVDVFVTSKCIYLYILCLVPRCLFQEVSVMYLSHAMPHVPIKRFNNVNKSCKFIVGNPPIVQGLNSLQFQGPTVIRLS